MSSVLARAAEAATRELELQLAAEEEREVELTEAERWARDPFGWINDYVVVQSFLGGDTSDRQRIQKVRMTLFPQQEETLDAWIDLEHLAKTGEPRFHNVVIEKSRQIGETVGVAAAIDWLLQHHRVTGLCMHLKLEKIDDGGPASTWESLFGKVRYIDRNLDRAKLTYAAPLIFKQKPSRIENPRSGGIVHGKGQEDDPGRGDSLDFAVLDEAAKIQHGELVHQSLASACPDGKMYLSTPFGDGNVHARISQAKPAGWRYLWLHWSKHPIYSIGAHVAAALDDDGTVTVQGLDGCGRCAANRAGIAWTAQKPVSHRFPGKLTSPWYDREINDKTEEQVAAEYDIDRSGALSGRVYREFERQVHVVDFIGYEPHLPLQLAADYGLDATSVIFLQDSPEEVRAIGIVEMGYLFGTTATPDIVAAELTRYAIDVLGIQPQHATPDFTTGWRGIGDPSGHNPSLETGRPIVLAYRRLGYQFGRPPRRLAAVEISVTAVKRLLLGIPKPFRVCGTNATALARHLENNTRETDAVGAPRIGTRGAAPLKDDIHNHSCKALGYWTVATYPPIGEQQDPGGAPLEQVPIDPDPLVYRRRPPRTATSTPKPGSSL